MAHYVDGSSRGFAAGTALALGTIVKSTTANVAVAAAAATDVLLGTITETVAINKTANVRLRNASGTSNVLLAGTVAIGDAITANASGLGITTVTAGNQIVGFALEAGVAGDVIEIMNATSKV